MVSVQFYSDGQIEISCGKEDMNYKKSWEHEWLMGNNQVLKRQTIHGKWQIREVSQ